MHPTVMTLFFFFQFVSYIVSLNGQYLIVEDFNCALNPDEDHILVQPTLKVVIQQFMKDLNLMDIWKERNPDISQYSSFSKTYNSYYELTSSLSQQI